MGSARAEDLGAIKQGHGSSGASAAEIERMIEVTSSLARVLEEADDETLILADVDYTLVEGPHFMGADRFFDYYLRHLEQKFGHLPTERLLDITRFVFNEINKVMKPVPVEFNGPRLMREAQERRACLIPITARGPETIPFTVPSLAQLGFKAKNVLKADPFSWVHGSKFVAHYQDGHIFCRGLDKGDAIFALFQDLDQYLPQRKKRFTKVIAVDDKAKNVQRMVDGALRAGRQAKGFVYKGSEKRVEGFNMIIAMIQLEYFAKGLWNANDRFLPDNVQAERILASRQRCRDVWGGPVESSFDETAFLLKLGAITQADLLVPAH